jgi:hypothetical protein
MTPATFRPDEFARDFVSWLSACLSGISAVDWGLVVAALLIVYFLRRSLVAANQVGPVEVDLLDCDAKDTAQVHALTATLREKVASSGLPAPPIVPAGAPQASLVKVIAASSLPQANFVAKVLEALPIPQPLQYKLSGTLFKEGARSGISYWLRPSGRGRPRLKTLTCENDEKVVTSTAFEVYSFISTEAVQAFPDWARWHSADSMERYEEGCGACEAGEYSRSRELLSIAAEEEPANALVRLQLANVHEQLASSEPGGSITETRTKAMKQAEALCRYLLIAVEWPWLVQARYRASVLAGVLVGMCTMPDPAGESARAGVVDGLRLDATEKEIAFVVKRIAKSQSDAVLQLLKPWYMVLRWQRLRSQFEPSAEERRQLKRAVGISRHCVRLRSLGAKKGWRAWLKVQQSRLAVRCWHLFFGVIRVDWQTHYLATCFDALLLERLKLVEAAEAASNA